MPSALHKLGKKKKRKKNFDVPLNQRWGWVSLHVVGEWNLVEIEQMMISEKESS